MYIFPIHQGNSRGSAGDAQKSMEGARKQVRDLAGASSDEVVNLLVSCDGTWQKRGYSSLFGVVLGDIRHCLGLSSL